MATSILQQIDELWAPIHGKLVEGFNLITDEWAILKRLENFRDISPREIKWPVDIEFGGGVAFTSDGGTTADARNNVPREATADYAWMTKRYDVTYGQFDARNDSKMAKARIEEQLAYQARKAMQAWKKRMAIAFYGLDDNVLADVAAIAAAPVYEIKNHYGITGIDPPVSLFTPNRDEVAFIDPATDTERGRELVVAVDAANLTIELAGTIANDAIDDWIVFANQGDGTTNDLDIGIAGLYQHATATSLFGIDGSVDPEWTAGVYDAAYAAVLSGSDVYRWFTTVERDSGFAPNFAFTTVGVIAEAGGPELDQRRYDSSEKTMQIGFNNINVMGVVPKPSSWIPAGCFVADSTRSLTKLTPDTEPEDVEQAGSKWHYYEDNLGYFTDQVYRLQLTRKSRKSLIFVMGITES